MGEKEEDLSRSMFKGHMDKAKGGSIKGGRWGLLGWEGVVDRKWRQLYLNNNKKKNPYTKMSTVAI